MLQSSIVTGYLSSAFLKKKKEEEEKKGRNSQGTFFLGQTCPIGYARHALLAMPCWDFPGCYMQLKVVLRVSP
jgi:hypothetical protein